MTQDHGQDPRLVSSSHDHDNAAPPQPRQQRTRRRPGPEPLKLLRRRPAVSPDAVLTDWASRVGQVTHAIICALAPVAGGLDSYQLGEQALREARRLVTDGQVPRGPAARARAVGLSLAYLRDYVPRGQWALLGTELPLPLSRIDVAWSHPVHGVLLDEIKTFTGRGLEGLSASDMRQAERHTAGGETEFGAALLGLRVLTLGGMQSAIAVLPSAGPVPLIGSGLHPDELPGGSL